MAIADAFAREVIEFAVDTTGLTRGLQDVRQKSADARKELGGVGDSAKTLGSQLVNLGTLAKTAFGAGLIGGITAIGVEFETATSIIVRGTGATGQALRNLQDDFKAVQRQVPESAEVVAGAIADLNTRLGLTGPALQEATKQLLAFARVNSVDTKEAVRGVTQLMNDLGISVDRLPEILDKLTAASQASGVSVTRLSQLVGEQDDALQALGFGLDESIALFAQFEKAGAEPESTIKALTIALKNMANEGVTDAHQALTILMDRIKSAPSLVDASKIAVQAFGKAGVQMAGDIRSGKFAIDDMLKVVQNAGGTLERTAKASKTSKERLAEWFNAIKVGLEPLGGLLLSLGAAPLALASAGTAAATAGGALKTLAVQFGIVGGAADGAAISVRGFSASFFGPLGLIAALSGGAVALYTYIKAKKLAAETDDLVRAGEIVGHWVKDISEAQKIFEAFTKGQSGAALSGAITADLATAWQKGAASAKEFAGQTAFSAFTLKNYLAETQSAPSKIAPLQQAQADLAAANKKYHDEVDKLRPVLAFEIQHLEQTGKTTKDLADKYGISQQSVERFKNEMAAAAKANEAYTAAMQKAAEAAKPLTIVEQDRVRVLTALGLGEKDIADILGVNEIRVKRYTDALKDHAKSLESIGKQLASIQHNVPLLLTSRDLSGISLPPIDVAAIPTAQAAIAKATFNDIEGRMHQFGIVTKAELQRMADEAARDYADMKASGLYTYEELAAAAQRAADLQKAATKGVFDQFLEEADKAVGKFESIFSEIAQSTDGAASEIASALASIAHGWNEAAKAAEDYANATTTAGKLVALGEGAAAIASATDPRGKSTAATVGGGAAAGARIGATPALAAATGGASILIGAGIGALIGWWRSAHAEWKKVAKDIGRDIGIDISQGLAQQIADLEKTIVGGTKDQRRKWAEELSLDALISDQGGLTSSNVKKYEQQATQLFEPILRGGKLGADATKELNTLIGEFAGQAEKTGGLWDPVFKNLIKQSKELGLNLDSVNQAIDAQISKLSGGVSNLIGGAFSGVDQRVAQLTKDLTPEQTAALHDPTKSAAILKDLNQSGEGSKANQYSAAIAGFTQISKDAQGSFDRLSRIALASFNSIVAGGHSAFEAVGMLGDSIDKLIAEHDALGLKGSAAYDQLSRLRTLTKDNQGLIDSVSGLNDVMTALANLGGLDADTFADLEAQGVDAFHQMTAAGFTQQEAEKAMAPFLQNILDLHNQTGLAIDDETQKLIDQATQDGVLKAKQIDTNQILVDGIGALIKAVGGDLPDSFKKFAKAGTDAANDVGDAIDKKIPKHVAIGVSYTEENQPPTYTPDQPAPPIPAGENHASIGALVTATGVRYLATGGPASFQTKGTDTVPAMLTPGEGVLNVAAMQRLGIDTFKALNDGLSLEDAIWKALPINQPVFIESHAFLPTPPPVVTGRSGSEDAGAAPVTVNFNAPVYAEQQYIKDNVLPTIISAVKQNYRGSGTKMRNAVGNP